MNYRSKYEDTIAKMFQNNKQGFENYYYYAYLLAQCKVIFDDKVGIAGVRFDNTYYTLMLNPTFLDLPLEQRFGILKHEMLHIISRHSLRGSLLNHKKYNIAADCAINQMINREHLPEGALYPDVLSEKYGVDFPSGLTAEHYYNLIPNSENTEKSEGEEKCEEKGEASDSFGELDDHSSWEEQDAEVAENIAKKMIETATEKVKGNVPSELKSLINSLYNKPKVSWKKVLNNIVGNKRVDVKTTIMRRDRRQPHRSDIKGKIKDSKFELITILDISGSMSDNEIQKGLSEIKAICELQKANMRIIQVDSKVQEVTDFNPKKRDFTRSGCGGTEMYPAIEYIIDNKIEYDGIVLITDGYCEDISTWEKRPKKPVIFLTTDANVKGIGSSKFYKEFKI